MKKGNKHRHLMEMSVNKVLAQVYGDGAVLDEVSSKHGFRRVYLKDGWPSESELLKMVDEWVCTFGKQPIEFVMSMRTFRQWILAVYPERKFEITVKLCKPVIVEQRLCGHPVCIDDDMAFGYIGVRARKEGS